MIIVFETVNLHGGSIVEGLRMLKLHRPLVSTLSAEGNVNSVKLIKDMFAGNRKHIMLEILKNEML